jgi:hypothetical protein
MKNKHRPNRKSVPKPNPDEILSEEELERIESDLEFRRMMKESEEDVRAGRYITHEEAMRRLHSGRARSR